MKELKSLCACIITIIIIINNNNNNISIITGLWWLTITCDKCSLGVNAKPTISILFSSAVSIVWTILKFKSYSHLQLAGQCQEH